MQGKMTAAGGQGRDGRIMVPAHSLWCAEHGHRKETKALFFVSKASKCNVSTTS